MEQTSAINPAAERENLYAFFSGICLEPPSETLVDRIKDGRILAEFAPDDPGNGFFELKQCVREAAEMPELMNDLVAEHSKLFKLPADLFPQEAFYLDDKKRMGGRVTMAVGDFYKAAGAEVMQTCVEMPDHIGIEFQFMQFLSGLEKDLRENGASAKLAQCLDLQKRFLQDHLLQWASDCCERIIAVTGMRFYKAMAYLMVEFLESERQMIADDSAKTKSDGEGP